MFTVKAKLAGHDRFLNKKGEEMQVISLYTTVAVFGKMKPKLYDVFIPTHIRGVEGLIEKTVIVPCVPSVNKGEAGIGFAEDGRPIQYHNEKGELKSLAKNSESSTKAA